MIFFTNQSAMDNIVNGGGDLQLNQDHSCPVFGLEFSKIYFLHFLLSYEERSWPKDPTRIFIYRYLNKEDIIDVQSFIKKFICPVQNRFLSYSYGVLPSFRQNPN